MERKGDADGGVRCGHDPQGCKGNMRHPCNRVAGWFLVECISVWRSRYEKGTGVEKNAEEAAKWYRKAADNGNADAQNNLGVMSEQLPRATAARTAQGTEGKLRWRRAVR